MSCGKIGKMKYIEELSYGDTFLYNQELYLLTSDFKNNGSHLAIKCSSGFPCWLSSQAIVETSPIFILDKEQNIVPVKTISSQS